MNPLTNNSEIIFEKDKDFTSLTTFRLKSRGDYALVKSIEALKQLLEYLNSNKRSYRVLGWGANQIFPPHVNELVIKIDFTLSDDVLKTVKDEYDLPASLGLNHLTAHASRFGLKGWEVMTGIPASLGGAIYMNAGTSLGEIGSLVKSVSLMNHLGEIRVHEVNKNSFSYRKNHFVIPGEIIIGARLIHHGQDPSISEVIKKYLDLRKKSQPLTTKNCGCVFKNISPQLPAGLLIDLMGLKGLRIGQLRISPKHANFIENLGEANSEDFFQLVKQVQTHLNLHFGFKFELEVKID
jgi:UDP-N-acetylmuramate dehydrogenase